MRIMTIGDRHFDPHVTRRSLLTLHGEQLDALVADLFEDEPNSRRGPGEPDEEYRRRATDVLFDNKGDPRGPSDGFELADDLRARLDAGHVERAA